MPSEQPPTSSEPPTSSDQLSSGEQPLTGLPGGESTAVAGADCMEATSLAGRDSSIERCYRSSAQLELGVPGEMDSCSQSLSSEQPLTGDQPPANSSVHRCLPGDTPTSRTSVSRHSGRPSKSSTLPFENTSDSNSTKSSLSPQINSNSSTPQSTPKSPISEFLVYPATVKKTKVINKSARILTSTESRALLEEKERKKREEEEAKAKRKIEREEKKIAREEEKKRKLEEREAKKAEQEQRKAEQQQKKGKGKASSMGKGKEKAPSNSGENFTGSGKRKLPGGCSQPRKTYPKRRRVGNSSGTSKYQETGQDACAVCSGLYKDDIDEETGCIATDREWIQCSDEDCSMWSHTECLEESDGGFICAICQNVFI